MDKAKLRELDDRLPVWKTAGGHRCYDERALQLANTLLNGPIPDAMAVNAIHDQGVFRQTTWREYQAGRSDFTVPRSRKPLRQFTDVVAGSPG